MTKWNKILLIIHLKVEDILKKNNNHKLQVHSPAADIKDSSCTPDF